MWYEYLAAVIAFDFAFRAESEDKYMAMCQKLDKLTDQIACLHEVHGIEQGILSRLMRKKADEIVSGGKGVINLKIPAEAYSDVTTLDISGTEEEFVIGASIVSTGHSRGAGRPIRSNIVDLMVGVSQDIYPKEETGKECYHG